MPQLLDLPAVLDQARLREELGDLAVEAVRGLQVHSGVDPGGVHQGVHVQIDLPHQTDASAADLHRTGVLGHRHLQLGQVGRTQTQPLTELLQPGARTDPELAVAGVGIELFGVPAGHGLEVERGLMVAAIVAGSFLHRLQHQHRRGLMVQAQTGQMGERRMRTEAVVGVVGPNLQRSGRKHQALTGEALREPPAAFGGEGRDLVPAELLLISGRPLGGHELSEGLGGGPLGPVAAPVLQVLLLQVLLVSGRLVCWVLVLGAHSPQFCMRLGSSRPHR